MDLSRSAMLVSVTIINGGLLGERRDQTATDLVQNTYSIADRRAKASKFLIDRKHPKVKAVVAAAQRVREVLYKYTMPWGDDKTRLLAAGVHDTFKKKMAEAEFELRQAWDEYLQVYPALIAASERELGDLFDRMQYPNVGVAKDWFKFRVNYWPMPSAGHFVADIAKEEVAKATAIMRLEIETRLKDAAGDLVERARVSVSNFVDKLEGMNKGAPAHTLRDSLLENLRDTGELIIAMNISGNEDINKIAVRLQRMARMASGAEYRERSNLRTNAATMGKEFLAEMDKLDQIDIEVAEMAADASEYEF